MDKKVNVTIHRVRRLGPSTFTIIRVKKPVELQVFALVLIFF